MTQKGFVKTAIALSLALVAELTIGLSSEMSALAQFKPPNRGAPRSTAGGATRSACMREATRLTALTPIAKVPGFATGKFGMTTQARPSFFVYLPKTKAQSAEFTLKDADEKDVYRTTLPLIGHDGGIVAFQLPADAPALEVGKDYQWFFNVICNPDDRVVDEFVSAWIHRVKPDTTLETALKSAAPRQRPNIFAQAGIWQDSLAALTELRRTRPSDPTVADEWTTLLKSVGLGQITGGPPAGQLSLGATTPNQ